MSLQGRNGAGAWETVTDIGSCALARSHLCMPSWGQDTVAVLTFQAEAVPVLAQRAHLLRCGEQGRTGLQGAKPSSRHSPFPPQPHPASWGWWGVSPRDQLHPARVPCPTGKKGVWDNTCHQLLVASGNPASHTRPVFSPSSAWASPKKTGCWQRGQVQLMAPLRAAGATHIRHCCRDCVPTPSACSTHGSASSLIGLNLLLLEAHSLPEI